MAGRGPGNRRGTPLRVRLVALLVPRGERREWSRGWASELPFLEKAGGGGMGTLLQDALEVRRIERERARLGRGDGRMKTMLKGLANAARGLRRAPAFTAVAVLTLGAGIAATTGIFAVVDHVLLRPLPYPEADRVVELRHPIPGMADQNPWPMSVAGYFHVLDRSRELETLGAYRESPVSLVLPDGVEQLNSALVTAELFQVLGAETRLGRLFTREEDDPGGPAVAVLSHGLWTSLYGADPAVLGSTLQLNDQTVTVVGVMEPDVRLPGGEPQVWVPWPLDRSARAVNSHFVQVLGRLAPHATLASAETEIRQMVAREFPAEYPNAYEPGFMTSTAFTAQLQTVRTVVLGNVEGTLWLLLAAVGLVLLLASANVANLFLVRGEVRSRELSVRRALGASRGRIRGLLVGESVVVGMGAGLLALLVVAVGLPLLQEVAPEGLPRMDEVGVDLRITGFTLLLSLGVGLALGFLPTTGVREGGLRPEGSRGTAAGTGGRLRRGLVAAQMALAVVLLASAGLMVRTARALASADPGFDPVGVVAFDYVLPYWEYSGVEDTYAFHRQLLDQLRLLPGVTAAGTINQAPMSGDPGCWALFHEDPEQEITCPVVRFVSDGYFEAVGTDLVSGSLYTADDLDRGGTALVISADLARSFWGEEDPMGKGLIVGNPQAPHLRVSGIVEDVHDQGLTRPAPGIAYFPLVGADGVTPWGPSLRGTLLVRAPGRDFRELVPAVEATFRALQPMVALQDPRPMERVVARSQLNQTFALLLLALAGGVAVVLGAVGLYAVIAYTVSRRRGEIGVRMALGAGRGAVAGGVVRDSLVLVVVGSVVGVGMSLVATRLLENLLFGVAPQDPLTLGGVVAVLVAVGTLAAWIPARRAAGVDPARALRPD